jgi:hypothetical protein
VDDKRLIDTSDLPLERKLLRAAAEETAPPSAHRRALAALDLLVVAPPAAAGSTTAAVGGSATRAAAKWSGRRRWRPTWGLVLGLGGATVGAAFALERMSRQAESSVVAPTPPTQPSGVREVAVKPPAPAMPAPRAGSPEAESTPPERVRAEPVRPVRSTPPNAHATETPNSVPQSVTAPAASDAPAPVSIRDEIDLLDRARAALARGAPEAALTILREYFARHPHGQLREEAAAVSIKAMRAPKNRAGGQ